MAGGRRTDSKGHGCRDRQQFRLRGGSVCTAPNVSREFPWRVKCLEHVCKPVSPSRVSCSNACHVRLGIYIPGPSPRGSIHSSQETWVRPGAVSCGGLVAASPGPVGAS